MGKCKPVVLFDSGRGWGIDERSYADVAERSIRKYMEGYKGTSRELSTSKLRNVYACIMNVRSRINSPEEFEERFSDVQYIKVKMAYDSGRNEAVKKFFEGTLLVDSLNSVRTYEQFSLYCRYAESLVAYFKFYGGKD